MPLRCPPSPPRPSWRRAAWACAAALALVGCSRASDEAGAKKWPNEPPPREQAPRPDLRIEVKVDGAATATITSATLAGVKPDYQHEDRQAWRIGTLVPAAAEPAVIEAVSPAGVSVKFERPSPGGIEPVLYLTRRGEAMVSALDPKDPFPDYHGQGGRLHRSGDSWPRVQPVARLEITRPRP